MKKLPRIGILFIIAFLLLVFPLSVFAQTPTPQPGINYKGDQVVVANTYRLETGDTLEGNLAIIGSTAAVAEGATLTGDIFLTGGTFSLRGVVNGDIIAIGGAVNLEDTAVVNGNIVVVGATLKRSPLAKVNGDITEQTPKLFNFPLDNSQGLNFPFKTSTNPLTKIITSALQALAIAALAVIMGLILPQQMKRVASTVVSEPLVTGGVGLLTIVIAPILLVILTITIILIPVAILSIMLLGLALLFGWIVIGFEIGERIAGIFHAIWHPAVSAGIGSLLLSLVTGFMALIPCVGWVIGAIVGIFGLGAVVISRFGSSKYANKLVQAVVPATTAMPIPPEPPAEVK